MIPPYDPLRFCWKIKNIFVREGYYTNPSKIPKTEGGDTLKGGGDIISDTRCTEIHCFR